MTFMIFFYISVCVYVYIYTLQEFDFIQHKWVIGTSLVVQWLRIHLTMQSMWVQSKLRSHTPQGLEGT